MYRRYSCPQGHRWGLSVESRFLTTRQWLVCPVCGAKPETLSGIDLPEADGTEVETPPAARPGSGDTLAGPADAPAYQILNELGRGGLSVVYRARHVSLQRTVALKTWLGQTVTGGPRTGPASAARRRCWAACNTPTLSRLTI
jgi:hypothetical protein